MTSLQKTTSEANPSSSPDRPTPRHIRLPYTHQYNLDKMALITISYYWDLEKCFTIPTTFVSLTVIYGGYLEMIGHRKIICPPHIYPITEGISLSVPHQALYTTHNHKFTQTNTSTPINGVTSISNSRAAACSLILLMREILSRKQYPLLAHDHEYGLPDMK